MGAKQYVLQLKSFGIPGDFVEYGREPIGCRFTSDIHGAQSFDTVEDVLGFVGKYSLTLTYQIVRVEQRLVATTVVS